MLIIGIDPGLSGAVAFLRDGLYEAVEDMPVVLKGSGSVKSEVSPAGLKQVIRSKWRADETIHAALERVNAMPGQGVSSVFSLGDSFGCARAIVASGSIPLTLVSPVTWKKHFKLTSEKEHSRALAIKRFPQAPLHLKKHVDRAEALLIALWLYETSFG